MGKIFGNAIFYSTKQTIAFIKSHKRLVIEGHEMAEM